MVTLLTNKQDKEMKELGITNIDSIKLRIDTNDQQQQQIIMRGITTRLRTIAMTYIQPVTKVNHIGLTKRSHHVMNSGKQIAAINTGRHIAGSIRTKDLRDVYYVSIGFYGLKRYHESDIAALQCLLSLCMFFNTNSINFRITQLDICHDINCPMDNVLALLNKRAPNVHYFQPDTAQENGKIKRIENIPPYYYNKASVRVYTYDKRDRNNWIDQDLTRFEIKLQSNFFKGLDKPLPAIRKAIDKYTFMYFKNLKMREIVLARYKEQWNSNKLDISKLDANRYIVEIDIDYVSEFLEMLFTISDDIPYRHLMPTRDKEALKI